MACSLEHSVIRPSNTFPRRSHVDSEWLFLYPLTKIGMSLNGHSRSRERTGFIIPELNIFLDAGVPAPDNPSVVLITHCPDYSLSCRPFGVYNTSCYEYNNKSYHLCTHQTPATV